MSLWSGALPGDYQRPVSVVSDPDLPRSTENIPSPVFAFFSTNWSFTT
jgi:hypothetical protein